MLMIPMETSGIERPISCEVQPMGEADEPQAQLKRPGDNQPLQRNPESRPRCLRQGFSEVCAESTQLRKKSKHTWSKSALIGKTKVVLTGNLRVSGLLLLLCLNIADNVGL